MTDFHTKDVDVVSTEKIETLRQVVHIPEQIAVPRILEAMWNVMRRGKFTGVVTMTLNAGGVRGIVTEEITSKEKI